MSRRTSLRLRHKATVGALGEVVDLLSSSSDEEDEIREMNKKPAARKKMAANQRPASLPDEVVLLLSDSDDEEEDLVVVMSSSSSSSFGKSRSGKTVARGRASPPSSDADFARRLQQQEHDQWKRNKSLERRDASFAASLQTEEEQAKKKRKRKEIEDMKTSHAGRSVLLVDKVIQIVENLPKGPSTKTTANMTVGEIEPVGKDDAVYLAEKMLQLQEAFRAKGLPTHVCLGYHYTNSANLDCIRTDGLLTIDDRIKTNNKNTKAVAHFGNGIYTATNQYAFSNFGDVGLLVAVLRGKEQKVGQQANPALENDVNTVIGNKSRDVLAHDEIILKESSQVLPLVRFPKPVASSDKSFFDKLWELHQQIQHGVLDEFFNSSTRTNVTRTKCLTTGYTLQAAATQAIPGGASQPVLGLATTATLKAPPPGSIPKQASLPLARIPPSAHPASAFSSTTSAGTGMPPVASSVPRVAAVASRPARRKKRDRRPRASGSERRPINELVIYNTPDKLLGPTDVKLQPVAGSGGNCSICISPLVSAARDIVKLPNCNDEFHKECIKSALKHSVKCPNCKAPATGKLQGSSPSGKMTILSDADVDVSGFPGVGNISITYIMTGGTQKTFHQNPGAQYSGTTRIAYLPDNDQGRQLLKRLKFAFQHGLMFTIGTSLTTRLPNMIVWAGIHVKTSAHGGAQVHGWPDPNYFQNANGELDGLGVPPATQI